MTDPKQGHAAIFASADYLEELEIPYQMAYSGKTLRCLVVQPDGWKRLEKYIWDDHTNFPVGSSHPVVRNTSDFREHVRRQNWRVSEWY